MKRLGIIFGLIYAQAVAAQQPVSNEPACDCPSCKELAASGKEFNLPALQGLEDHAEYDHDDGDGHDPDAHEGHDHAAEAVAHDHDGDGKPDHDSLERQDEDVHEGHDHGPQEEESHEGHDHGAVVEDSHEGHDHETGAEGIQLTAEMISTVGIQIHEAEGGTIAKSTVFPAEIKLNRDRTAAVSPRYASIVRQVFAEIGDAGEERATCWPRWKTARRWRSIRCRRRSTALIISKDLAVGETAGDDRVLFEVADLSTVWADISIFPQYQHLMRKGMPVEFIAHDGHSTKGVVKYISPIVSHETRTFTARCVLEGADEDFTPGAFVRARIHIETVDVPVVSARSRPDAGRRDCVLFVPRRTGFPALVVELGLADDQHVEIKSGLQAGRPLCGRRRIRAESADGHQRHGSPRRTRTLRVVTIESKCTIVGFY